jgi:V/A-type H+-transporting ATPase subunit C
MKPLKYKEIMPRTAIEKLKLIELDDAVSLINKDVESIRSALLESPYRDDILRISKDKIDSISLEEALLENYVRTCKNLIKFSSGDIRRLLLAVLKKFEVSNVKAMLRAVKAKMDVDEAMTHIISVGTLDKNRCRAILAGSKSIEDVINSLCDLEYGLIMKGVLNERQRIDDLLPLEVALDKVVYQGILKSVEKLKGLDRIIARGVLGIEIDAINVKIILRFKAMRVSQDQIKDYLMPTALIDEKTLEKAMKATNVKSTIECLLMAAETAKNPFYQNIFTQILRECDAPLSRLEAILDKASLKMSLDMLKEYTRYYNIGFILAFLNLKWVEVKNLRCIIKGSERKIPPSQVRKLLTLPDEW